MDEHPVIYIRDGGSGPRPAVVGTHLDVAQIIATLRQNANSIQETADYLDLSRAQIEAALRYYADHKDEIDSWLDQSREIAERERST